MKFPQDRKAFSKKPDIISRKSDRTSTSTNDVSQRRSCNESYMFLTTFGPSASIQDEIKEVEHQGEFINFKILLQCDYYASNNTHFPA